MRKSTSLGKVLRCAATEKETGSTVHYSALTFVENNRAAELQIDASVRLSHSNWLLQHGFESTKCSNASYEKTKPNELSSKVSGAASSAWQNLIPASTFVLPFLRSDTQIEMLAAVVR